MFPILISHLQEMDIADYLNEVVNHEASLAWGNEDVLAEGVGHEDAIATVTDVAVESSNSAIPVVAPFLFVLPQLGPIPGIRLSTWYLQKKWKCRVRQKLA